MSTGKVSIQQESFESLIPELKVLVPVHYKEVTPEKEQVPIDINYEFFKTLDEKNQLLVLSARNEDKELVGYFVGYMLPHMHHKDYLMCTLDAFYIIPEYRNGWLGLRLFKKVEELCRQKGAKRLVVGSKLYKDASSLFERLGYTEVGRMFSLWF